MSGTFFIFEPTPKDGSLPFRGTFSELMEVLTTGEGLTMVQTHPILLNRVPRDGKNIQSGNAGDAIGEKILTLLATAAEADVVHLMHGWDKTTAGRMIYDLCRAMHKDCRFTISKERRSQ